MADTDETTIAALYARFNARDVDGVLALLAPDVLWANAMEGGYAEGRAGVRAYWARQWAMVDPTVTPLEVTQPTPGTRRVRVRQVIRDLAGAVLADDEVVHQFTMADGEVARFDVPVSRGWD